MNICVYGAASELIDDIYKTKTYELGEYLADQNITMVFGAGACGVMGACARGVFAHSGKLIGIVPRFFTGDGIRFENCTETIFTETMRERKKLMEEMSDAFIVAPGGVGTFDEFFEIFTLQSLGRHKKPIAVYNVNGYYDPMLDMLKKSVEAKFIQEHTVDRLIVSDCPKDIIEKINSFKY